MSQLYVLAKQELFNEYNTKRNTDFQNWLIASENSWVDKRLILRYPEFITFDPKPEEITARMELILQRLEGLRPEKQEVIELVEEPLPKKNISYELEEFEEQDD